MGYKLWLLVTRPVEFTIEHDIRILNSSIFVKPHNFKETCSQTIIENCECRIEVRKNLWRVSVHKNTMPEEEDIHNGRDTFLVWRYPFVAEVKEEKRKTERKFHISMTFPRHRPDVMPMWRYSKLRTTWILVHAYVIQRIWTS